MALLLTNDYLGSFLPSSKREMNQFNLSLPYGRMNVSYFNTGNNITFTTFDCLFDDDVIVESIDPANYGFFYFNQGNTFLSDSYWDNKKTTSQISACSFLNGMTHGGHTIRRFFQKDKHYCCSAITVESTLFQTLTQEKNTLDPFYDTTCTSPSQNLLLKHLQQEELFQGTLKNLFLESKILELTYLCTQEEILTSNLAYLNKQDKQALQKAKQIIFKERFNPPSIKELSRRCAINEFKLKKGFKELFGDTIYGMVQTYRLEEAKDLLIRNDISVQEAARLVGYASLNHFRKIFKERYGILPVHARSRLL